MELKNKLFEAVNLYTDVELRFPQGHPFGLILSGDMGYLRELVLSHNEEPTEGKAKDIKEECHDILCKLKMTTVESEALENSLNDLMAMI